MIVGHPTRGIVKLNTYISIVLLMMFGGKSYMRCGCVEHTALTPFCVPNQGTFYIVFTAVVLAISVKFTSPHTIPPCKQCVHVVKAQCHSRSINGRKADSQSLMAKDFEWLRSNTSENLHCPIQRTANDTACTCFSSFFLHTH